MSITHTKYLISSFKIRSIFPQLFIITCIVDPMDFFKLKVPFFILSILINLNLFRNIKKEFLLSITLFILIPLSSVIFYEITDGTRPFEGYNYLKAYLLVIISIVFFENPNFYFKVFLKFIRLIIIANILLYLLIIIFPDIFNIIYNFGRTYDIFTIEYRDFFLGAEIPSFYFNVSPLYIFPFVHYLFNSRVEKNKINLFWFLISLLGIVATLNRTNVFIALIVVFLYSFFYNKKTLILIFPIMILLIDWIVVYQYLESIFSTTEISNMTKLGYLDEYVVKLWDTNIFLFGEGLGSYTFWSSNGVLKSVTELTYFEIIRYYGIFGAFFLIVLMLYPALKCLKKSFKTKVVGLAFLFFLIMSSTNPMLFNSIGMLMFSLILSFSYKIEIKNE